MDGKLLISTNLKALNKLVKISEEHFNSAMEKGAIQFLTWCNTGSANASKKPPIRWGVLRGSSSAFVGSKLVLIYPQDITPGSGEEPSPLKQYKGKPTVATFVWNTDYAHRMHEWKGGWGPFTMQDGDAGNKWLEDHLRADKDALMKMVAIEFKMEMGT